LGRLTSARAAKAKWMLTASITSPIVTQLTGQLDSGGYTTGQKSYRTSLTS